MKRLDECLKSLDDLLKGSDDLLWLSDDLLPLSDDLLPLSDDPLRMSDDLLRAKINSSEQIGCSSDWFLYFSEYRQCSAEIFWLSFNAFLDLFE